jgi:hypothetical protein
MNCFVRCGETRFGLDRIYERIFAFVGCALIFLSFCAVNSHNFANHFRVPRPAQSTVRNFFVTQGEDGTAEGVVQIGRDPTPRSPIVTEGDPPLIVESGVLDGRASNNGVRFHRKLGSTPSNPERSTYLNYPDSRLFNDPVSEPD